MFEDIMLLSAIKFQPGWHRNPKIFSKGAVGVYICETIFYCFLKQRCLHKNEQTVQLLI